MPRSQVAALQGFDVRHGPAESALDLDPHARLDWPDPYPDPPEGNRVNPAQRAGLTRSTTHYKKSRIRWSVAILGSHA